MVQVRALPFLLFLLLLTLGASLASAASSSTQPSIVKPVKKLALVSGLVAAQWNFTVPEHVLQRAFFPQVGSATVVRCLRVKVARTCAFLNNDCRLALCTCSGQHSSHQAGEALVANEHRFRQLHHVQ